RQKGHDYMALMTPVLKGFLTDRGFAVCSDAMQVHGGSGFTEHFPVSQYLRDCRIALIYEGTNGIQALDLVGRKLAAEGGRGVMGFFAELDGFIAANEGDAELKPFLDGLAKAKAELQEATLWLMQNGLANPDNAGAASTDYLHLFGLTALGYMWAMMARTALRKIAGGATDPLYLEKLAVGRYYLARVLPETATRLARLKTGAETLMALPAEAF
ncbi:MAG: acyl-CoA dehydrogenase, partial [Phenylobacterium sp.]